MFDATEVSITLRHRINTRLPCNLFYHTSGRSTQCDSYCNSRSSSRTVSQLTVSYPIVGSTEKRHHTKTSEKTHMRMEEVRDFCNFMRIRNSQPGSLKESLAYDWEWSPQAKTEWVWIDTKCIDKRSSAELTAAINSMFNWYQGSTECVAYLADVSTDP